jgi:hypothetical protein
MAAEVGDVFNYPGTDDWEGFGKRGGWHIQIVIRIDESRGDAYLVPLSTVLYRDRTCEIDVKDGCPLVTKPCVVAYIHGKKIPSPPCRRLVASAARRQKSFSQGSLLALVRRLIPRTGSKTPFARPDEVREEFSG